MAELVETLRALLSNDNNLRSSAEKRFDEAKAHAPERTVAELFKVVGEQSVEEAVREQGAVLLRQCLSKVHHEGSAWSRLSAEAQQQARALSLQQFESEERPKVRRKVADIIQSLGNQLINLDEKERPSNAAAWPEMMPTLMRVIMDASKAPGLRADALWAVKEMQVSIWQIMIANGEQTVQVLRACLTDGSEEVRANAAVLFCEMIDATPSRDERKPFECLVDALCQVITQLSSAGEAKQIDSVLQALQGTTESADFFKESLATRLLPILSTVAKSHGRQETQRLALEVMISFAESKPKAMAKVPGFIQATLDVSVHFLLQLGDDISSWAEADDDEEDEENFTAGKEVVDRLCRCMQKADRLPHVMEVLKAAITVLFQTAEWKQVVAGVTVLSQLAEYIEEEAMVQEMVGAVNAQLRAEHPRVRHAAWSAVAQFAQDHCEVLTNESLAPVMLPEFLRGLDDQSKRVLERCMEAFQQFGGELEREVLEPFVSPMMEKLGKLLQCATLAVQREAITFIAVIAGQVEEAFAPYYGPLMPLLKQLAQNVLHKTEERVLLGKVFECISLLANAVGPVGFRQDAQGIMEMMIAATQVPNLPSNDPVKEYMMAASERICATMKADFLPFVPHILPGILERLTLAPKEYSALTADNIEDNAEVSLSVMHEDGKAKIMVMNTSEMEDLQNALSCVNTFVEKLGKLYAPYVAQTAQALLPVFNFSMGEEIRDLAFETWGQLCDTARESQDAQMLSQFVQELLNRVLPSLEERQKPNLWAMKTKADGVAICLRKAGPQVLTRDQVKHVADVAMRAMSESFKRGQESGRGAAQDAGAGDNDEDEDEEDGADDEDELRKASCQILGALMQHHPEHFMVERLEPVMTVVQELLQRRSVESDYCLALLIVCDLLEHLQQRVTPQWPSFMPQVLQGIMDPSAEVRQLSCFGASLAARSPAFAPMAVATAQQLGEVISQSRKRAKKKSEKLAQASADNALSALVEILMNHQEVSSAQAWGVWLNGLPCQEDEEEGMKNHNILLKMVEAEKAEVVGEGGANLQQILSVLVEVYKTDMADEETSKGIRQLVRKIGESKLGQLAGGMKDKQQKKLHRIYRDAQQEGA